jgi:hypothetical protein
MRLLIPARAWSALVASIALAGPVAAQRAPALEQYLQTIGLGAQELAAAAGGSAVVHLLPTTNDRDVAVFGMIRVRASRDSVTARALDVKRLLVARGSRFQVFGNPPTSSDVRDAAIDPSEYRDLQGCRPGDCGFKLPASGMREFVEGIDWSSPEAKAQADEKFRAALLRLAVDYSSRGNEAMLGYDDIRGVRSSDVFGELVERAVELRQYAPELAGYLMTYPDGRPSRARDVLYWSEDRVPQLRPMFTLNHAVVYIPSDPSPSLAFVARKQIYANHYFEGALELLAVVDGAEATDPGTYVVIVRRFRFDNLPGGPQNVRGRVRSRLVERTRLDLERHWATMGRAETR